MCNELSYTGGWGRLVSSAEYASQPLRQSFAVPPHAACASEWYVRREKPNLTHKLAMNNVALSIVILQQHKTVHLLIPKSTPSCRPFREKNTHTDGPKTCAKIPSALTSRLSDEALAEVLKIAPHGDILQTGWSEWSSCRVSTSLWRCRGM